MHTKNAAIVKLVNDLNIMQTQQQNGKLDDYLTLNVDQALLDKVTGIQCDIHQQNQELTAMQDLLGYLNNWQTKWQKIIQAAMDGSGTANFPQTPMAFGQPIAAIQSPQFSQMPRAGEISFS